MFLAVISAAVILKNCVLIIALVISLMFVSISHWTAQYVYPATGVMLECFKLFCCTECTLYRIVFMVTDCHCHVMSQWTAAVHIGKQQTELIVNIVSLQNVF